VAPRFLRLRVVIGPRDNGFPGAAGVYEETLSVCHSHARLTFFSFSVVTLWNNLPNEVVSASSLNIVSKEDWPSTGETVVDCVA